MTQNSRTCSTCCWRRTFVVQVRPRQAGAERSGDRNYPLRNLPQRPPSDLQRLGNQPVPVHSRHEISHVTAVGAEVRSLETGQRVGLGWQSNSCGICEWCTGEWKTCALPPKGLRPPATADMQTVCVQMHVLCSPYPTLWTVNMQRLCYVVHYGL